MYKRQRLPGPPATVRSVGTGQAGEVELRRQTPISADLAYLVGVVGNGKNMRTSSASSEPIKTMRTPFFNVRYGVQRTKRRYSNETNEQTKPVQPPNGKKHKQKQSSKQQNDITKSH